MRPHHVLLEVRVKTKKIYQILFPGLSYEMEPLMDGILLSCAVVCSISVLLFSLAI